MKDLLLIYNARLVDKNKEIKKGAILIEGEKISGFPTASAVKEMLADENVSKFDARGCTVLPSFVDMHVHMRDPGLTQKEDIRTGCMAAAAGGFGTVVLMPNTVPVISSEEMAEFNDKRGDELGYCQVIQSVSITENFEGKSTEHLKNLSRKIVPLITEDGHEVASSAVMLEGMKIAAKKNIIVSCHCEDPDLASEARPLRKKALDLLNKKNPTAQDKKEAAAYLKEAHELLSVAEDTATFRNIRLAEHAGVHLHLCHVSTAECIDALREAKKRGINVTAEITPHHIALNSEKADTKFQIVNPPLRPESDRQAVIKALMDGTADVIATDHAPHTAEDKASGAPGFSGLETAFAACYTTLCLENGMNLKTLSDKMSARPAEILGLSDRGLLDEGLLANLTIVDTEKVWTVRGEEFASKGKYTPLEGKKLTGEIQATFYRGKIVFQA
ncbi:MAG: dihydroorotase [Treponema sp.]|nr:dihydroorotase [Treponema sp.]MBR6295779.1 dihydroorotase [Treponema sp.]